VNDQRTNAKLASLEYDTALVKIARAHSEDMARRNFFNHVNPDGKDPTERGEAAGYVCRKVSGTRVTQGLGENLFQANLYSRILTRGNQKTYDWNSAEKIASEAVAGWMKSPGHRQNILQRTYTKTGIGIAIANDDKVYVTQVFC
jgi:uncharacterized protein YkwD